VNAGSGAAEQPSETRTVEPVFLFSIARSGSTLVQRVLGTYPEIATVAEPWILIPLLYTLRRGGVISEYTHPLAVDAIEDFARRLPRGEESYRDALRSLVLDLYAQAAPPGTRLFLDKTPPYFLVIDEVLDLFPDARCVLLWRNPLSVIASLARFEDSPWNPVAYKQNFFDGVAKLTAAQRAHGDRLLVVNYEDLVTGEPEHWRRITDHFGVEFDPASLSRFREVELEGRMGDPHGVRLYHDLSREPLTKWRGELNTPIRKAWCRRYLRWLGEERLALMGYDLGELLAELDAVPTVVAGSASDARELAVSLLKEPYRVQARRSLALGGSSPFRYLLSPTG
jgi:hypothetical protein